MQTSIYHISGVKKLWSPLCPTSICIDLQCINALVIFLIASLWILANKDLEMPICLAPETIHSPLICFSLRASISSWPSFTTWGSLIPSMGCRIVRVGVKLICLSFFFLQRLGISHAAWYEKDVICGKL